MNIFPAIDLRKGAVVRLEYGDPNRQTTFGDDPVAVAREWVACGASWLHVVNLDGAFDEAGGANWAVLPALTQQNARVQFGGGIRTLGDVERALNAGISRIVLGTVAIENPALVEQAVTEFGAERIAVGIDALDGRVKTRGWQTDTPMSPMILGLQVKNAGIQTIIHTDIARDGVLTGANVDASAELAAATGLQVIVSGGVAGLDDVRRAKAAGLGIAGIIIGRALYDGKIDLAEAIEEIKST
jgi:phosphoribosylformimino-5-aminoimidazole carboxamide ribotide isomerase